MKQFRVEGSRTRPFNWNDLSGKEGGPVPASTWKALTHQTTRSTSAASQVRKADPVPASTWKATHHQAIPLNLGSLSGQISELVCQVFLSWPVSLRSALGPIRFGPVEIVSAAGRGSKSPRNKGRAFANSDR
jgi:hypothetical protein